MAKLFQNIITRNKNNVTNATFITFVICHIILVMDYILNSKGRRNESKNTKAFENKK